MNEYKDTACAACGHRRELHQPWHAPSNAATLVGRACTWDPPHSDRRCDCTKFVEPPSQEEMDAWGDLRRMTPHLGLPDEALAKPKK